MLQQKCCLHPGFLRSRECLCKYTVSKATHVLTADHEFEICPKHVDHDPQLFANKILEADKRPFKQLQHTLHASAHVQVGCFHSYQASVLTQQKSPPPPMPASDK